MACLAPCRIMGGARGSRPRQHAHGPVVVSNGKATGDHVQHQPGPGCLALLALARDVARDAARRVGLAGTRIGVGRGAPRDALSKATRAAGVMAHRISQVDRAERYVQDGLALDYQIEDDQQVASIDVGPGILRKEAGIGSMRRCRISTNRFRFSRRALKFPGKTRLRHCCCEAASTKKMVRTAVLFAK